MVNCGLFFLSVVAPPLSNLSSSLMIYYRWVPATSDRTPPCEEVSYRLAAGCASDGLGVEEREDGGQGGVGTPPAALWHTLQNILVGTTEIEPAFVSVRNKLIGDIRISAGV